MVSVEELAPMVAALCFLADCGDDGAALELDRLADDLSSEVIDAARQVLIGSAAGSEWDTVSAIVDLIAAHYCLDTQAAWNALFELERDVLAESGTSGLPELLATPKGVSLLGERIAFRLGAEANVPLMQSVQ